MEFEDWYKANVPIKAAKRIDKEILAACYRAGAHQYAQDAADCCYRLAQVHASRQEKSAAMEMISGAKATTAKVCGDMVLAKLVTNDL